VCGAGRLLLATVLTLSLPAPLDAQLIPGGKGVDTDLQAAQFMALVLGKVKPLMASWHDAWRGQGEASIESRYEPAAVLALPGGPILRGRESVAQFAQQARMVTGELTSSMLDFDAADGMAYHYGSWDARSPSSGEVESGRLVTIAHSDGEEWLIRAQLFTPDTLVALLPVLQPADPLEPLTTERVGSGRSAGRQRAIHDQLVAMLATLRRAWAAGDAAAVGALLRDDALIQLPAGGPAMGAVAAADLARQLPDYRSLHTVELDFEQSGSIAYLLGRYYTERRAGPPRSGNYIIVFKNSGSGWLIRSLVFT